MYQDGITVQKVCLRTVYIAAILPVQILVTMMQTACIVVATI